MVKCEKRDYGYEIHIEGATNDVIDEIVYLAAAYHVNLMTEELHVDMKKDKERAIMASIAAFGILMEKAMKMITDEEHTKNIVLKGDAAKGGAVQ